MTNSKWFSNEERDPIGELYRRIASAEMQINDLSRQIQNSDSPTPISRVDPATYQNPYEGQRAIDPADEQHMWYSNGQWRKAAGGSTDIPWARREQTYGSPRQSITSSSTAEITWDTNYNMGTGESGEPYFAPDGNDITIADAKLVIAATAYVQWNQNPGAWWMALSRNTGSMHWSHHHTPAATIIEESQTWIISSDTISAIKLAVVLYHEFGSAREINGAFLHVYLLGTYTGDEWSDMNPNIA